MRRSCKYYDWGDTVPKQYGAFCSKKKEFFHKHESGIVFPVCNKCEYYTYKKNKD